jgi:hypothetical protein
VQTDQHHELEQQPQPQLEHDFEALVDCVPEPGGGDWFTTSPDLITWSRAQKFLDRPNGWQVRCGDPAMSGYASVIDPSSTSRNFTTTGSSPYFYFTLINLSWPSCATRVFANVSLVRIPLRVAYSK